MPSGSLKGLAQWGQANGPLIQAAGTIAGGISENRLAHAQADQMVTNAGQAKAVGQRNAINTRLNTQLTLSRQTALAAASGAGVMDPTMVSIQALTGARGEYAALTDLYNGDSQAQDLLTRAAYTRASGRNAQTAAMLGASKTLAGGAVTLLDRYGGAKPSWFDDNPLDDGG